MKVSIIIPAFNEEQTIEEIISRVLKAPIDCPYEVIVINDGSCDHTADLLSKMEEKHAHVLKIVNLEDNHGKGYAVRQGIERASGDVVLIQDADLEYSPNDYPDLIAPFALGHADVVCGSRMIGPKKSHFLNKAHRWGNQLFSVIFNLLTGMHLSDVHTCYKVFRKSVLNDMQLSEDGFGLDLQLMLEVAKMSCPVYEVSVCYEARDYKHGKKIHMSDGFHGLSLLIRSRFF